MSSFESVTGDLCALPWDPTTGSWKIFYLYTCARYSLSNWNGNGVYLDNQTPNAVTTFEDQSGSVREAFTPDRVQHSYNWSPIWAIRNC